MALEKTPSPMISSKDIAGTAVYGKDRSVVGNIDHLIIRKETGEVVFAVMNFGGFLGLGTGQYPIPWKKLEFDIAWDGYVTDLIEEDVKNAPEPPSDWYTNRQWEANAFAHYQVPVYWR